MWVPGREVNLGAADLGRVEYTSMRNYDYIPVCRADPEADRDANAAYSIPVKGLEEVGTGCPGSTSAEGRSLW